MTFFYYVYILIDHRCAIVYRFNGFGHCICKAPPCMNISLTVARRPQVYLYSPYIYIYLDHLYILSMIGERRRRAIVGAKRTRQRHTLQTCMRYLLSSTEVCVEARHLSWNRTHMVIHPGYVETVWEMTWPPLSYFAFYRIPPSRISI